ncbi:MAG: helix-hairpin-helix domain-containing protein, partial [Patescibacteria group bacterium]
MSNQILTKILSDIALYLEMEGVPFKPQAYSKAAVAISSLSEDIQDIYKEGGIKFLEDIPGVGKSIAQKIEEYLKTGNVKYYEDYKKKVPVEISELTAVEGIGPKIVKALWKQLKVKNLPDLEKAAKLGKIRKLPHFGEKTERNILEGIKFLTRSKGRFLLGDILPRVRKIEGNLRSLKEIQEISVAGSVRRMKETIGDVDFLVITKNPAKVMDFFVSLPGVVKIWSKGTTKSSVRMEDGFDVDVRVIPKISYGAALQYFTGSKEHNIQTRLMAIKKGLKLNEYGVFRGKKMLVSDSEEKVYEILGIPWMEP